MDHLRAKYYTDKVEAGCDEAGRGCLAGPVYAAAVILPEDYDNPRLNDSKKLSEKRRVALAEEIKRDALAWSIGTCSPEEIDNINILNASMLAMHRALDQLSPRPEAVIVDGNHFKPYRDLPHTTIIKGDGKYQSIAAASILAKTARDEYMDRLAEDYPQYDWRSNKGYPTKAHRAAIKEHGITPHHRRSYQLLPEPSLFDSLFAVLLLCLCLLTACRTSNTDDASTTTNLHANYFVTDFTVNCDSVDISAKVPEYEAMINNKPFSVTTLNSVRNDLTNYLTSNGYYHFNKDFIDFTVDTAANSNDVQVELNVYPYRRTSKSPEEAHPQYTIASVDYTGYRNDDVALRRRTLLRTSAIHEGDLFSSTALQQTYNNFANLQAVRYTNITLSERPDTTLLDCTIKLSTDKPSSISLQPEATNTAGDLGAALALTYTNSNLFHGSEQLAIEGRVAYEAITGLEGYTDQDYQEYSLEARLSFPMFVLPIGPDWQQRSAQLKPSTELAAAFDMQNRPEFYRRVFTTAWRYRWTMPKTKRNYKLDLLEINYVYMPWISDTFREDYLESAENRNAILLYNYEDLFIMKTGISMSTGNKHYSLRYNLETSGNFVHKLLGVSCAQYVKGDFEYTKNIDFSEKRQLALHAAVGLAYPYGNSNILPFEKRYFAGGANSVRGWTVRSLGPGRFKGENGTIDFINQTGDMRLDINAEWRAWLFWKFYWAAFIDAGNIWTLREYDDQEGGQFRFDTFYEEIAVAYGLGLRLNLGYFILRFDFGMKAINPCYTSTKEHYPIIHPDLGRDLAVHFAVGLPF